MSKIFSSFSNPSGDLKQLQKEFIDLFNFFNSKEIHKKVDFEPALNDEIPVLTSRIIAGQKEIRLFHFSGHSGKAGLDFPVADFGSEQVIKFFNTICSDDSKIQCVFLNGCENEHIVEKLCDVPVVIGTRTEIQDSVARKFTKDFFGALIQGESTYRQAFLDAASAQNNLPISIVDKTRAAGGLDDVADDDTLNDYFMVINNADVAGRKFPFKKGKTNWTKYLVLFFILIALVLGFLFRDPIWTLLNGFDCPVIKNEENKCSFAIGDFISADNTSFSLWVYGEIEAAKYFDRYFIYKDVGLFSQYTKNSDKTRDDLPGLCNYDFNLTGSVNDNKENYVAHFNISPSFDGQQSLDTFSYTVETIEVLGKLITTFDPTIAGQFLLYELCIQCAIKKDISELSDTLRNFAQTLDSARNSTAYQRLYYDMATVHLKYGDSTAALTALYKSSKEVPNDFGLASIERTISISKEDQYALRNYEAHSYLMEELGDRVAHPEMYEMNAPLASYTTGQDKVRFDRAMLVHKHRDERLKDFRDTAIADLLYLQSINYPPGDFYKLIADLQGDIDIDTVVNNTNLVFFKGKVSANNEPLRSAKLSFGDRSTTTNANGEFTFGELPDRDFIGKKITVQKNGFQKLTATIKGSPPWNFTLKANPVQKRNIAFQVSGVQKHLYEEIVASLTENGFLVNASASGNMDPLPANFAKTPTVYYRKQELKDDANYIASLLRDLTGESFQVILISPTAIAAFKVSTTTTDLLVQWPSKASLFNLQGNVISTAGKPLQDAIVVFGKEKSTTNGKGYFDFGSLPEPEAIGKLLLISRTGFKNARITISEESLRNIVLEPAIFQFNLSGRVFSEYKKPIQGALVVFGNDRKQTNAEGYFDFGTIPSDQVIGKQLRVTHKEFVETKIVIDEISIQHIVMQAPEKVEPDVKHVLIVQGLGVDEKTNADLIRALESKGYDVDQQRSSIKKLHVNTKSYSAEIYFHHPHKEIAYAISKIIDDWGRNDYDINIIPVESDIYGVSPENGDITIRYRVD